MVKSEWPQKPGTGERIIEKKKSFKDKPGTGDMIIEGSHENRFTTEEKPSTLSEYIIVNELLRTYSP